MRSEEDIVKSLCDKFPFLVDKVFVQKSKRIYTKELTRKEFNSLLGYIHDELGFYRSSHVVGTDDGETLGLLYLFCDCDNVILALRESVPKSNPVVDSISELYPSVILHERELVDLFGVKLIGLPDGPRYPLPDGWPEGNYPMRKDWDPKCFNKNTMTYECSTEVMKDE